MYLKRITVEGYRAAAQTTLSCEFKSRFSLILGANGSGKTTINEAIALAHPTRFPWMPPIDASVLGHSPRKIKIEYAYEDEDAKESVFGQQLKSRKIPAPNWENLLERSMGNVRVRRPGASEIISDNMRLVYLPAARNPVDELSRRDTRILLELFRAMDRKSVGSSGLSSLKVEAKVLLESIISNQLIVDVETKIAQNMGRLSMGVSEYHAFVGTQVIDDTYLARVFEMLLAVKDDRDFAKRLQISSLGYVNLLHIAIVLAAIPESNDISQSSVSGAHVGDSGISSERVDDEKPVQTHSFNGENDNSESVLSEYDYEVMLQTGAHSDEPEDLDELKAAYQRIGEAERKSEAEADSFFPEQFHVLVLIEEPEAHLHPQLQYGLIRYLRELANERNDIQVIVTTHSADLAASCEPEDVILVRKNGDGIPIARNLTDIPLEKKIQTSLIEQTRLHLDATRSAALFADRLLLVEGVTEAALLRVLGRVWSGDDQQKAASIDALAILPLGSKVGPWPIRLLATNNFELVTRVAALADTDKRGIPRSAHKPPKWHRELSKSAARFFWSHPTLEPTLVLGNEEIVRKSLGFHPDTVVTPESIDEYFRKHRNRKASFAIRLSHEIEKCIKEGKAVKVPDELCELFSWLFS